ncbi:hypothetical protein F4777DRAFT_392949 [Nemania sp. FL0916]|nr:hypothetical protein F4777DRAFT_392949 [Nemania sp. FL0916]
MWPSSRQRIGHSLAQILSRSVLLSPVAATTITTSTTNTTTATNTTTTTTTTQPHNHTTITNPAIVAGLLLTICRSRLTRFCTSDPGRADPQTRLQDAELVRPSVGWTHREPGHHRRGHARC